VSRPRVGAARSVDFGFGKRRQLVGVAISRSERGCRRGSCQQTAVIAVAWKTQQRLYQLWRRLD
jgi:hypothetical protein